MWACAGVEQTLRLSFCIVVAERRGSRCNGKGVQQIRRLQAIRMLKRTGDQTGVGRASWLCAGGPWLGSFRGSLAGSRCTCGHICAMSAHTFEWPSSGNNDNDYDYDCALTYVVVAFGNGLAGHGHVLDDDDEHAGQIQGRVCCDRWAAGGGWRGAFVFGCSTRLGFFA